MHSDPEKGRKSEESYLIAVKYNEKSDGGNELKNAEVSQKKLKKFFWVAREGIGILCTADAVRAKISYPPFLWITMCISILKQC